MLRALIRLLFGKENKRLPFEQQDPPRPDNWSKTLDDLFEEIKKGERKVIQSWERKWAIEYEREQHLTEFEIPKNNDLYIALKEHSIDILFHYRAPYSDGMSVEIEKGFTICADGEPVEFSTGTYFKALDPHFEDNFIPKEVRMQKKYSGYHLFLTYKDLKNYYQKMPA